MRILATNIWLCHRTGTELYLRDIELALRERGHEVVVYTPRPGSVCDEIRQSGGQVVTKLHDLQSRGFVPDIIHGHHDIPTVDALRAYPDASAVFVCHDAYSPHDEPPLLARIREWIAVDNNCLERLVGAGIDSQHCQVVANGVDLKRFRPRSALPNKPKRALMFSNYARDGGYLDNVREACRQRDLALDVLGEGTGTAHARPEDLLGAYDIVFAKGRAALEAMAVGNAVLVCDFRGLAGMVDRSRYEAWRPWNFGARTMDRPHEIEGLCAELDRYDAGEAGRVAALVRSACDVTRVAAKLEQIYETAVAAGQSDRRHAKQTQTVAAGEQELRDLRAHDRDSRSRRLRLAVATLPVLGPLLIRTASKLQPQDVVRPRVGDDSQG